MRARTDQTPPRLIVTRPTDPLLVVSGVTKAYGDTTVLRDVSLTVDRGQVVVVIGPSGGGKSTLLRCVAGLEPIQKGSITLDGHRIREAWRLGGEVGFVFQQFNLFPNLTAIGNVQLALRLVRNYDRRRARSEAIKALQAVGLGDKADSRPSKLSGGQQQRVAIARSLAMNPRLMLFDEVTSALDRELVAEVLLTMEDLARREITMLVVTHELNFAEQVADRILFMDGGVILAEGLPAAMLRNPPHARLRQFLGTMSSDLATERLAIETSTQ